MGTKERKQREKDQRRQLILNAAEDLFMVKGFKLTTMADIAEKAELSPATIYLYFEGKEELYATLNLNGLQFLHDEVQKIYSNAKLPVEKKLIKYKEAMYKTFQNDPMRFRLIAHIQLEDTLLLLNHNLLEKINEMAQKVMSMMANTYNEGVQKKLFEKGHPMGHADIMWGMFTGIFLWEESKRRINPQKDYFKATVDRAFDIFLKGVTLKNK